MLQGKPSINYAKKGIIVNTIKGMVRCLLALGLGYCCLMPVAHAVAAEARSAMPPVIEAGLALWAKSGPDVALDSWQRGGMMEGGNKARILNTYFRQLDRALGDYKASELLESKSIGQTSQVVYLSLHFQRGAVYGRFVLYRTDKTWVVQNMDFNTKPEAIMPWLAFEGVKYTE